MLTEQNFLRLVGTSIARHGLTSIITLIAVRLSFGSHSFWIEASVTFAGSLLSVVLMVVWSWVEKKKAVVLAKRYVKAALLLEAGASMDDVVALATAKDKTISSGPAGVPPPPPTLSSLED